MGFDPVAYLNEPRWRSSRLGLERISELLDRLGRPQDALRFVHVAGTNGKGSVCAYLASVLKQAGYKTGLFTSPYIERFEERICVNGACIPMDALTETTLAVREAAEAMDDHPTEFELMCAVALAYFARERCDIAVLEVGLGGRFDATNAIDAPEVSVIARIGLDHTDVLGDTIGKIAFEKAGIIKAGSPVVSWPQEPDAARVISEVTAERGCSVREPRFAELEVGAVSLACDDADAPSARRRFSYGRYRDLETSLLASYQPCNAALAIEAVEVLRERGWNIDDDALRSGIAETRWPARFEIVGAHPLVIVDGGHNPQGARALAESLRDVVPGVRPVFIVGVLADKDYPAMLSEVVPLGSAFIAIAPDNPRALSADSLAEAICAAVGDADARVVVAACAAEAARLAYGLAGEAGVICAFGSLYSVAQVRRALIEYNSANR